MQFILIQKYHSKIYESPIGWIVKLLCNSLSADELFNNDLAITAMHVARILSGLQNAVRLNFKDFVMSNVVSFVRQIIGTFSNAFDRKVIIHFIFTFAILYLSSLRSDLSVNGASKLRSIVVGLTEAREREETNRVEEPSQNDVNDILKTYNIL